MSGKTAREARKVGKWPRVMKFVKGKEPGDPVFVSDRGRHFALHVDEAMHGGLRAHLLQIIGDKERVYMNCTLTEDKQLVVHGSAGDFNW